MGRGGTSDSSVMRGVLDWVSTIEIVVVVVVVIISGIVSSVVLPLGSVELPDPSIVVEASSKSRGQYSFREICFCTHG